MRPPPLPPRASPGLHRKAVHTGTKPGHPAPIPAHTSPPGPPRPRTSWEDRPHQWVSHPAGKWSVWAGRREAVAAQIQAFGGLFCAAHTLPSVRVSAGGSSSTCALTPPALTGRSGGRHMAEAGTADGRICTRKHSCIRGCHERTSHVSARTSVDLLRSSQLCRHARFDLQIPRERLWRTPLARTGG